MRRQSWTLPSCLRRVVIIHGIYLRFLLAMRSFVSLNNIISEVTAVLTPIDLSDEHLVCLKFFSEADFRPRGVRLAGSSWADSRGASCMVGGYLFERLPRIGPVGLRSFDGPALARLFLR